MKKSINIGILGCANIAHKFIIPTLLEMSEYNVIGIASRTKEKAMQYSDKFDIKAYYSYESLLNVNELDAIYIPLPNALHAKWIGKALKNDLHVLVEKSLATTLVDVQRLNKIAFDKNLTLIENFQFRFHKQLEVIQELLNKKKIGSLRCVRSSFGFPPFLDKNNIRYKKELGGGALLDAGAYPIKISQLILGNDIEVSASNLCYDENIEIDIWGGAYLKQKKGDLFSEIAFGFDNYYQCNLEIWGSIGKITANRIFTSPPGTEAKIILETNKGKDCIKVEPDNHFKKMLSYFYELINKSNIWNAEYEGNINQARLIAEIRGINK